jgi:hypothetical protein
MKGEKRIEIKSVGRETSEEKKREKEEVERDKCRDDS